MCVCLRFDLASFTNQEQLVLDYNNMCSRGTGRLETAAIRIRRNGRDEKISSGRTGKTKPAFHAFNLAIFVEKDREVRLIFFLFSLGYPRLNDIIFSQSVRVLSRYPEIRCVSRIGYFLRNDYKICLLR